MALPSTLANQEPNNDATLMRRIEELERRLAEMLPSVAKSFAPVIADLQAQDVILSDLIDSQVVFDSGYANSGALSLTTTEATVATFGLTIPSGYTRALVQVNGSVGVVNPLGSTSSVACRVYAQPSGGTSQWGPRRYQSATAGQDAAVYSQLYQAYTGLSGGTFTFWLNMLNAGGINWGATSGGGTVEAQVTYLR